MSLDYSHPQVVEPPEHPGAICTQSTFTLTRDDLGKHHQTYPYGTTIHGKSYGRRTAVERGNAYMDCHYGTLKRGTVRTFGLSSHLLLLALKVAAVNIQIIDAHREIHLTT